MQVPHRRARVLVRLACPTALLTALVIANAPAAHAQTTTLSPEINAQFDAIIEYNYRNGVTNPTTAPPCQSVCDQLTKLHQRPGPSTVASRAVIGEAAELGGTTGTLPKPINMSWAIWRVNLALGTFTAGMLLGNYVNKKWLKIGIPQSPDGSAGGGSYYFTNNTAVPFSSLPTPNHYPSNAIFYWQADVKSSSTGQCPPTGSCSTTITNPDPDHPVWPEVPEPFHPYVRSPDGWHTGYLTLSDIARHGPITDYTGQPFDYSVSSPPDPGLTAVRDRTRTELESGKYPRLVQRLEHDLGTPNICDPVESFVCNPSEQVSVEDQRRCDLSDGGTNADPDPTRTIERNHPDLYDEHQPFERLPVGAWPLPAAPVPVPLRKGWTKQAPSPKLWAGWGWRHIQAKHGWSQADMTATAQALLYPVVAPLWDDDGAIIYRGATYRQNGAVCHRLVVVRDAPRGDEPMPAGIITSYGFYNGPDTSG